MCGISGAIGIVDERIRAALARVDSAQRHRGPDGHGSWNRVDAESGVGVAFEHRRLAIIDLDARAAQPMVDSASGNVIAFNGEIYNFQEIKNELIRMGVRFETKSDTEVILAAWNAWGDRALERLAGMFAFALYEKKTGDVVFARDRVGIKPLYFGFARDENGRADQHTILFASEVRALLASNAFDRALDPAALAGFAWHGFVCGDSALVRGIHAMPPGTVARISPSSPRVEPRSYWIPPRPARRRADTDEFAETLERAVREHMIADVPLAVFLSGGVDSSAIANLASRERRGVRTYHVGFDEVAFDESRHARAVAHALGTDHTEIRLSAARFRSELPEALASLDQPTFDGINTWFVSRAVRAAGIVVALAGTGGDELFGGYSSFRDLPRVRRASRALGLVPRALISGASRAAVRARSGNASGVLPQTRWGKLGDALGTRGSLVDLYQTSYALFAQDFGRELIAPRLRELTHAGLAPARARELAQSIEGRSDLDAVSVLEIRSFLSERLLRDTDAVSMAASLEVRVPLLDHRVIEAAFALEDGVRFEALGTKRPLRRAGLAGLDPALFDRPKSGFVLPIDAWCRAELSADIDAVFADVDACRAVGLEQHAVAKLWTAFKSGAPGIYWSRIWALYVLLRWCDRQGVKL